MLLRDRLERPFYSQTPRTLVGPMRAWWHPRRSTCRVGSALSQGRGLHVDMNGASVHRNDETRAAISLS